MDLWTDALTQHFTFLFCKERELQWPQCDLEDANQLVKVQLKLYRPHRCPLGLICHRQWSHAKCLRCHQWFTCGNTILSNSYLYVWSDDPGWCSHQHKQPISKCWIHSFSCQCVTFMGVDRLDLKQCWFLLCVYFQGCNVYSLSPTSCLLSSLYTSAFNTN